MNATPASAETNPSRFRPVLGIGLVLLLVLLATAGYKSARELAAARRHESELVSKIASAQQRIRGLQHRIDQLEDDPLTLERLAREELGMVRSGDVVIVLPDDEEE